MSAPPRNQNARKPASKRRSVRLSIRATREQVARWRRSAHGIPLARWIARAADGGAR